MKMMKMLIVPIAFSIILGLAACSEHHHDASFGISTSPPALIVCTSKLDNTKIQYYSNQDTVQQSTFLPGVTIHYIIETNGQHVTLNSFEFKNYNCVRAVK